MSFSYKASITGKPMAKSLEATAKKAKTVAVKIRCPRDLTGHTAPIR